MINKQTINLVAPERERLEKFISSGEHKARHIQHAQVILKAAEGWTDQKIAEAIGLSAKTVLQLRHRYLEEGIDALLSDKPRSGRPPISVLKMVWRGVRKGATPTQVRPNLT
jgi:hypothetical protein